uniref:Uncharacterized protein n=1 Tax=viral metagenome TaxID=1070528 RepID=A0A6M3LL32_9ZZZZ
MFNEAIIRGAVQIANARIKKRFPLMEEPVKEWMIEEWLLAAKELLERCNDYQMKNTTS